MTTVNQDNSKVTFQGKKLTLEGKGLKVGDSIPAFKLTAQDMSDLDNSKFAGKILVIAAVPSLDTPTCHIETKRFNKEAEKLSPNVAILSVSMDLPFAQKRWCGAEGATRVMTGSDYKYRSFGKDFGCFIQEWGLHARAVFVIDQKGKVAHVEYVPDISAEPNYEAALKTVSALSERA